MTQYIFDVTALRPYLARHGRVSGIQRVSIMTIDRARLRLGTDAVWFGFQERTTGRYKLVRCPADPAMDMNDHATLCALLRVSPSHRSLPRMEKYARRPFKRRVAVLLRDLNARLGRERYFTRRGLSAEQWTEARRPSSQPSQPDSHVMDFDAVVAPGDHLVLLDNAWHPNGLESVLERASRQLQLEVSVLIHDLVPVVTPHYTQADTPERLYGWLQRATKYVTRFLANSENTARDLRRFLALQGAQQSVEVVPLAQSPVLPVASIPKAQIPEPLEITEASAPTLVSKPTCETCEMSQAYAVFHDSVRMPDDIRALTKLPYVLIVGTMEIRKNLWSVATVWDRLRHERGRMLPKLIIAGRRGWMNGDFDALMEATGRLGGWVEIVEGPDDEVLDYLYRHCEFTITASFYEGWGLPIGESLGYGKTAVVSNTSSMPEVGQDLVEYCNPYSLDDIEAACLRLIDDPAHRKTLEACIAGTRLRSWDDVAADMLIALAGQASPCLVKSSQQ